jgi:hypothetical protein
MNKRSFVVPILISIFGFVSAPLSVSAVTQRRKEMKTLRRLGIAAIVAFVTATLLGPPAWASSHVVNCTDGGTFTIDTNVVTTNSGCVEAVIPGTVISIGNNAFNGSTSLTSITIPSSVTSFGRRAFFGATNLRSVNFEPVSSLDEIGVQAFFGASQLNSMTIPSTVTSIGSNAFYGTALTEITIPNGVTLIEYNTFYGMTGLTEITIPSSVTSIDQSAFEGASNIASVNFDDDSALIEIGGRAFYGTALTEITIPSSVLAIGGSAFENTRIASVDFDDDSALVTIGGRAFFGLTGLTSITIPSSVRLIAVNAFSGASSLTNVNFEGNAPTTVDSSAFSNVAINALANVGYAATGFGEGTYNGLTLSRSTGPALIPFLSASTRTADGYTFQITNYDADYTWTAAVTSGSAMINGTGLVTISGVDAGASSTVTVTVSRQYYANGTTAGTASALEAPPPPPYSGPIPTNYSDRTPSIGDEVTISGLRLNLVTSCTIDGVTAVMSNQSADSFTIVIPAGLEPGLKDLVISSTAGRLTARGAFTIQQSIPEIIIEASVSSKVNAGSFNGYVAVFARGHKGKTLAWKIDGKWFKTTISSDYQVFQRKTAAAGLDVDVHLYIDGEKQLTKKINTR